MHRVCTAPEEEEPWVNDVVVVVDSFADEGIVNGAERRPRSAPTRLQVATATGGQGPMRA